MLLCCIGHLKKLNTPTTTTEAEVIGFGGGGYGDYYRYYNGHEDNVVQEIGKIYFFCQKSQKVGGLFLI